jgi:hypothetical protein
MGDIIEPWVLVARRYARRDSTVTLDDALRAAEEGEQELQAWRRPIALTTPSARDPGT